MVQATRRTSFNGSTLVRLLAGLTDVEVPESRRPFADRLSHWLGWADAITLSSALNGGATSSSRLRPLRNDEEDDCRRVRAALVKAIVQDGAAIARDASTDDKPDFAPYRRHYVARQQAMESTIGPLRVRLRKVLEKRSPEMAQLAALDAVMERVLGVQEYRLLSTVPGWLERHYRRLARAEGAEPATEKDRAAQPVAPEQGEPWQEAFGTAVQNVLLAELDVRMQPVEGLLAALRTQ